MAKTVSMDGSTSRSTSQRQEKKRKDIIAQQKGKLGTLTPADEKANTPAWQNRMKKNKKGERLYDFGPAFWEA